MTMTALTLEIEKKARRLPAVERERLAERLLAPLAKTRLTAVEEAWISEAERRYAAWKRGQRKAVPAAKAMASCKHRLRIPQNHRFRIPHPGGKE
jgi:putative addiction module component (TIGR02574 family)